MFQSVAPRPGKVAFQIEPFPVPDFQVVPEETPVTPLPVAEHDTASLESAEESPASQISPFLMAVEVEEEMVVLEESAVESPGEEVKAECPAIDPNDPFFHEEKAAVEMSEVVEEEPRPENRIDKERDPVEQPASPFQGFESSTTPPEPPALSPEETSNEEQTAKEVEMVVLPPAVTSWQPPAPSEKKKSAKFGAFFRQ